LLVVGFASVVVLRPQVVAGHHPMSWETTATRIVLWTCVAVLSLTAWTYVKRARLGRDAVQYALALACAMCVNACLSLQFGRLWRLSWWDYHAYLLIGFGAAVAAIVREHSRARAIDDVMRPIATRDPFEQIANKYTESLKPLVAAVEAKDVYTHGHSMRTAEVATRLGHRMKLDADTLRALAEGAYLHDIGKLALPDAILNKAGSLDPYEREIIERHPLDGYEIVRQASSLAHALPVVRHHHERFDGRGYPDGLAARDIPLIARVASVADVWDALTSRRAYRDAWREDEALAHILAGRGLHFDPVVVDAFVTMLAESGIRPHARTGEPATVTHACETCHHLTGVVHQHH
jgi:putative nucleotidyltransferase with HDIG domain